MSSLSFSSGVSRTTCRPNPRGAPRARTTSPEDRGSLESARTNSRPWSRQPAPAAEIPGDHLRQRPNGTQRSAPTLMGQASNRAFVGFNHLPGQHPRTQHPNKLGCWREEPAGKFLRHRAGHRIAAANPWLRGKRRVIDSSSGRLPPSLRGEIPTFKRVAILKLLKRLETSRVAISSTNKPSPPAPGPAAPPVYLPAPW
jgi:hypothetical protein